MKFLCDEMLQRLGSWLRAAGYDTVIVNNGESDYELLKQAIKEGRLLITRDRKLMEYRRAKGAVILLEADSLEESAAELSKQVDVDWLYQPFQRCMVCNTPLINATEQQVEDLQEKVKPNLEETHYCTSCKRVYWEGGHVHRMRERLENWNGQYVEVESQ